jgi:hypothetical protein
MPEIMGKVQQKMYALLLLLLLRESAGHNISRKERI